MYIKSDVDLDLTLVRSAQAFQWYFDGREYVGHAGGHEALIIPGDDGFEIISPCTDEAFWRDYFDLGRDYAALKPICDADPYLKQSYDALHGLHVLNQPVWDTLPSFIISANNNVARIRVLVKKLCDELGERRELNGIEIHLFPTPEALAAAPVETLRAMGMGYRAPYLIESAQAVVDGFDLNQLRTLPYEQAHKKILQLKGVGPRSPTACCCSAAAIRWRSRWTCGWSAQCKSTCPAAPTAPNSSAAPSGSGARTRAYSSNTCSTRRARA